MTILILVGGSGSRLWPLSRSKYPKQFILFNQYKSSFFQMTLLRALKFATIDDIYFISSIDYLFLIQSQVESLGLLWKKDNVILEPKAMNTLPAITAGVYFSRGVDTFLVMPSDHLIENEDSLVTAIKESIDLARNNLITFGIRPYSPKTGYGYIEKGIEILNGYKVNTFKEKPSLEKAEEFIESGYLWNSGIFMFSKNIFISELAMIQPNLNDLFSNHKEINSIYSEIKEKISIDYGLLELSKNVSVVPLEIKWSDLGSFDALDEVTNQEINKSVININSNNNYISNLSKKITALIDVENLIIVDTEDALLISKKSSSEKVKEVVNELVERNDSRFILHSKDYRPWGNYQILDEENAQFKVKRIYVSPNKRLSYQMHTYRNEHWVVVKGTATVTIDDEVFDLLEGESTYIKSNQKHRLENKTDDIVEIIEVQLGSYLEEDDIIRFDDDFSRN